MIATRAQQADGARGEAASPVRFEPFRAEIHLGSISSFDGPRSGKSPGGCPM